MFIVLVPSLLLSASIKSVFLSIIYQEKFCRFICFQDNEFQGKALPSEREFFRQQNKKLENNSISKGKNLSFLILQRLV